MKIKFVGIFIALIFLIPSTMAVPKLNSNNVDISETQETGSQGKPDLVITKIYPYIHDIPLVIGIACEIRNKGDAPAVGPIDVSLSVRRGLFGLRPVFYDVDSKSTDGFEPSSKMIIYFDYVPDSIGFYLFKGKVDIYNRFDESDNINNARKARYLVVSPEDAIMGWWGFG